MVILCLSFPPYYHLVFKIESMLHKIFQFLRVGWFFLEFFCFSPVYPGLRLESLAAAAIAAEPQPQAFDPDWYPYRKIRECKRKTLLFFYHVIPTEIICL